MVIALQRSYMCFMPSQLLMDTILVMSLKVYLSLYLYLRAAIGPQIRHLRSFHFVRKIGLFLCRFGLLGSLHVLDYHWNLSI